MTYVHDLPCAYLANVVAATGEFRTLCPLSHRIIEVLPLRHHKKPYCRWTVRYVSNDGNHAGGKNAKDNFDVLIRHPINAIIHETARCEAPPSWVITYSILTCRCGRDFNYVMTKLFNGYSTEPESFAVLVRLNEKFDVKERKKIIGTNVRLYKDLIRIFKNLRSFPLVDIIRVATQFNDVIATHVLYLFTTLKDRYVTEDNAGIIFAEEEKDDDIVCYVNPDLGVCIEIPQEMKEDIEEAKIFIGKNLSASLENILGSDELIKQQARTRITLKTQN